MRNCIYCFETEWGFQEACELMAYQQLKRDRRRCAPSYQASPIASQRKPLVAVSVARVVWHVRVRRRAAAALRRRDLGSRDATVQCGGGPRDMLRLAGSLSHGTATRFGRCEGSNPHHVAGDASSVAARFAIGCLTMATEISPKRAATCASPIALQRIREMRQRLRVCLRYYADLRVVAMAIRIEAVCVRGVS